MFMMSICWLTTFMYCSVMLLMNSWAIWSVVAFQKERSSQTRTAFTAAAGGGANALGVVTEGQMGMGERLTDVLPLEHLLDDGEEVAAIRVVEEEGRLLLDELFEDEDDGVQVVERVHVHFVLLAELGLLDVVIGDLEHVEVVGHVGVGGGLHALEALSEVVADLLGLLLVDGLVDLHVALDFLPEVDGLLDLLLVEVRVADLDVLALAGVSLILRPLGQLLDLVQLLGRGGVRLEVVLVVVFLDVLVLVVALLFRALRARGLVSQRGLLVFLLQRGLHLFALRLLPVLLARQVLVVVKLQVVELVPLPAGWLLGVGARTRQLLGQHVLHVLFLQLVRDVLLLLLEVEVVVVVRVLLLAVKHVVLLVGLLAALLIDLVRNVLSQVEVIVGVGHLAGFLGHCAFTARLLAQLRLLPAGSLLLVAAQQIVPQLVKVEVLVPVVDVRLLRQRVDLARLLVVLLGLLLGLLLRLLLLVFLLVRLFAGQRLELLGVLLLRLLAVEQVRLLGLQRVLLLQLGLGLLRPFQWR